MRSFEENLVAVLISECDKRAKKLCKEIANGIKLLKTGIFRSYVVFYKGSFADRAILKVVRLIDTKTIENEYAEEQIRDLWVMYNMQARRIISTRISLSVMKYITSFN